VVAFIVGLVSNFVQIHGQTSAKASCRVRQFLFTRCRDFGMFFCKGANVKQCIRRARLA
jgi:hypothetical protein